MMRLSDIHNNHSPRIIVTSGFSFSGASAFLDFLTDHEGVTSMPFECRWISHPCSFASLQASLEKSGEISLDCVKSLTEILRGEGPRTDHALDSIAKSILSIRGDFEEIYLAELEQLSSKLYSPKITMLEVTASCSAFILAVCSLYSKRDNAHTIVLDQAVRPWFLKPLQFLPTSQVFIVRRDLRDQIIERKRHGIEDPNFVLRMKKTMRGLSKNMKSLKALHTFHQVWFEDLVLYLDSRQKIRRNLGLGLPIRSGFNPIASLANLQLYKKRPDLISRLSADDKNLYYRQRFFIYHWLTRRKTILHDQCFADDAKTNLAGAFYKTQSLDSVPVEN